VQIFDARAFYTGQVLGIADGVAGIRQTTRAMAQIVRAYRVDPNLRARAITIVQLSAPKDAPSEIRALYDFVANQIRYVNDVAGVETLQTPDKTLLLRAGDCDDKAILLAVLLQSIGYAARFIVTGYHEPDVFEHVYLGVPMPDGSLLSLDPTEPAMPMGWAPANPVAYYEEII
jgi:transglutaminase-like putative cysteine protease